MSSNDRAKYLARHQLPGGSMRRMRLALDYVSQPYLNFMQWMARTKNAIGAAVFVLWFWGGLTLHSYGVTFLGLWIFGEDTWLYRIFILGVTLLLISYHLFYIFPRLSKE